jgi:hypothetical protein
MDACGQVIRLLAPKGFSRCPCLSRGQRLARVVRRGRYGGRFFLAWEPFSCHGVLHPRHAWAASVPVLPRAARREAPLVASTCCIFGVAWKFLVFHMQGL